MPGCTGAGINQEWNQFFAVEKGTTGIIRSIGSFGDRDASDLRFGMEMRPRPLRCIAQITIVTTGSSVKPMNVRKLIVVAAMVLPSLCWNQTSQAQESSSDRQDVSLFGDAGRISGSTRSDVRRTPRSAAELRMEQAQFRARQRIARLEYNLWMGYEPLRPKWNSVPMMNSRYAPRRIYIPVYVYQR